MEACKQLGVIRRESDSLQTMSPNRQSQYGPNKLAEQPPEPTWKAFLRQYKDLMQLVLIGVAIVSIVALGDIGTGVLIFGLTVFNAVLGVNQEGKAAESVAALRKMLIMKSKVRRNGEIQEVPAEELVPGDIVTFEAGDKVPADGRLINAGFTADRRGRPDRRERPGRQGYRRDPCGRCAAGRPHQYGVHEHHCHPRARGDAGDRHRHGNRDGRHFQHARSSRGRKDSAHQAARSAHDRDHDCRGGRPGADRRHRPLSRPIRRANAAARHQSGHLGHSHRYAGRGHHAPFAGNATARARRGRSSSGSAPSKRWAPPRRFAPTRLAPSP